MSENTTGLKDAPLEFLRRTGAKLLVDKSAKHAMRSTGMHIGLLKRAWEKASVVPDGDKLSLSVDLREPVGISQVVAVPAIRSCDPCFFARRSLVRPPSRVIVTNEVPRTSIVSLIGDSIGNGNWSLRVAYFGEAAPPEPTDVAALERLRITQDDALDWWLRHAFLFGRGGPEFQSEVVEACWDDVLQVPASRWRKPAERTEIETDAPPSNYPSAVTPGDGEQPDVSVPDWNFE